MSRLFLWLLFFDFVVFFSGESCRVVFGDSVFWLCFCFLCVSFFARINFLCWSRCQTTRANEQNFVCIQPNLSRTTSNQNYITQKCIPRRGEPVPPPIHTFLNFLFSLIQKICKIVFVCIQEHTKGFDWMVCVSNHIQP